MDEAWRKKALKKIPSLANRVFALRDEFYAGCGFHYDMERELGAVIRGLNVRGTIDDIVTQVAFDGLVRDVTKAERSAKRLAKKVA